MGAAEQKKAPVKKVATAKQSLPVNPEEGLSLLCSLFTNASVKNNYNSVNGALEEKIDAMLRSKKQLALPLPTEKNG